MCWPTRTTSRNDGNGFRPRPGGVGPEPTTTDWGWAGGAGRGRGAAQHPQGLLSSLRRPSPLRSSRDLAERYAQSSWPESHPVWCHAGHTGISARPACPNTPRFAGRTTPRKRSPGSPGPEPGTGRGAQDPDGEPDSAAAGPSPDRVRGCHWGPAAHRQIHARTRALRPVSARAGREPRARPPDAPSGAGAWRSPRRSRHRRRGPRPCARGARHRSRWDGRRR